MIVIGVTGSVGTGKSTVANMFKDLGAVVIDADVLAHEAMEPKRLAWRRIAEVFGKGVLNDDQTVNRRLLARTVFADEEARKRLEDIIHPQVLRRMKQKLHSLKRQRRVPAIVLDVPLLLEVGAERLIDRLIVVTAPDEMQRARLKRKHGWTDEEVTARINAQWDLSAKAELADDKVDNGGDLEYTRKQVRSIWQQIVRPSR